MLKNKPDHTKLLCDVGELSGLFTDSTSLENFLQKIVEMVAQHMHCDVCSIYLYDEDQGELVMKANKGLNPDSIGKVKLKLGEGLTGLALKEHRPICERNASKNPNFRYFAGLGEEQYESFLAVPIIRGNTLIGAMVVQNTVRNYFTEEDIRVLKAVTSQLANTIETTRLILSIEEEKEIKKEIPVASGNLKFVKGKVGAGGFAFAEIVVLNEEKELASFIPLSLEKKYSLQDFLEAVAAAERQLEEFQNQIEEGLSDVASLIFTAQILMLKDKAFIDAIAELINKGVPVVEAVIQIIQQYVERFENLPNPYLKEKSQDVRDIGRRILENLLGKDARSLSAQGKIVVARELFPSDALKLSSQHVKGIILLSGGVTSHLCILAQSLEIPVIIADVPELISIAPQTKMIMDAEIGNIYVNPSEDIIRTFKENEQTRLKAVSWQGQTSAVTETKDGVRVTLMANINLVGDLKNAILFKAEGIGLYRTEFPFIVRSDFPSEEEQLIVYKKIVDGMPGEEITFRTLDIGGDKVLSYFEDHTKEKNPNMGMRSIRFSLKYSEIFSQQIRSIVRAGVGANIRIMFPMISSIDEFLEAKAFVRSCLKTLENEKLPYNHNPSIGLMIELPAVVEVIDELAEEADFFSIGTNDFIQYMLAVDRSNEKVSHLYLPHHPAILRALKKVADAAYRHGKDISICGDMAHEEKYLACLLGIGLRKFSLNPVYIPKIREEINKIDLSKIKPLTEAILNQSRLKEIRHLINL